MKKLILATLLLTSGYSFAEGQVNTEDCSKISALMRTSNVKAQSANFEVPKKEEESKTQSVNRD
ncbi:hypothetical protein HBN50_15655 [Halobacteriovorax sp. GB3]|uniref:hypothetical protein n=1 Tax=Halobacteriovorax sp. GB3 TaxID=2719615 RepID=UPI002360734E|nr:hypothetical protein [Halobacteriovorax sp. GB3]MDD0854547.1 hypothetical protein [Halobacteriovorax sp. GB3]